MVGKGRMANGEMGQGNGVRPVSDAVPGRRPGTFLGAVATTFVIAGLVPFAVLLIPAAAGIVEIAGDKACSGHARFESAVLCRPGV